MSRLASFFQPAKRSLFLAPMAGITHAAFRRLVASFGKESYTALFTEMLPGRLLLNKDVLTAHQTKRRPEEGPVIYQLLLNGEEDPERIVDKLRPLSPDGLDLNAACPAPALKRYGSGFGLFPDPERLRRILRGLRKAWTGPLSVKCRLGATAGASWKGPFRTFLTACEDSGADFLTLHGRFADEKLKSTVRLHLMEEVRTWTRLPVVANGDITDASETGLEKFQGKMLGRIAVCRPWVFRQAQEPSFSPDFCGTWSRFYSYACEDIPATVLPAALKAFGAYFARNFFFNQVLYGKILSSLTPEELNERVLSFLAEKPRTVREPSFAGL